MKRTWIIAALGVLSLRLAQAEDSATLLARILAEKGAISRGELEQVEGASASQRVGLLAAMLEQKGLLTRAEVARLDRPTWDDPVTARLTPAVYTPAPAAVAQAAVPAPAKPPKEAAPSASPVTAATRVPVAIYGTLLTNAFFNTALTNIQDVPVTAGKQGSDAFSNDKNFGMTARQSRFGMRYTGPVVAGAKLAGQLELDLFGGKAALGNGISMDLVRLRLAYGRLDWKDFSLEAGQDWSVFAPLNPTSLANFAIPSMSGSGNPWIRTPQFRTEWRHSFSDAAKFQWQIAAVDPNVGDYQTAAFLTSRAPSVGERGRMPGIDTRLGFTNAASGREFGFGLSGHYGRGKDVGAIGTRNVITGVDSWGVAVDYTLPLHKKFALTGELYEGRALGIFSVSTGEPVLPVGTPGQHGVESRGGWMQAQVSFNPKLQTNLVYGIDTQPASNLRTGDRNKNQTYMGNLQYKWSPQVTFAWEWRRFITDWLNQRFANEAGDHFNMAVAYTF